MQTNTNYNSICDRSPCSRLLAVLGRLIHGAVGEDEASKEARLKRPPSEDGGEAERPGFAIYLEGYAPVYVTYCPFCGTRLDCVGIEILSRYRYRKLLALKPASPHSTHRPVALPTPPVVQTQLTVRTFYATFLEIPIRPRRGGIHKAILAPISPVRVPRLFIG